MDEAEKKALERLRRVDRQWSGFRWVLLGLGAFNMASGASSYFRHGDPVFGVFAGVIGLYVLVLALRDWRGNASRTLLLALYRDR